MNTITANEIKMRGVSALEELLKEQSEVIISVRGKPRYVVMEIEQYDHLRECEIEAAWLQTRRDMTEGRYVTETAEQHIDRITQEL